MNKMGGVGVVGMVIDELFREARVHRSRRTDGPDRLTGRHCKARLERAKAKRTKGRVKANKRKRAGRKTYTP